MRLPPSFNETESERMLRAGEIRPSFTTTAPANTRRCSPSRNTSDADPRHTTSSTTRFRDPILEMPLAVHRTPSEQDQDRLDGCPPRICDAAFGDGEELYESDLPPESSSRNLSDACSPHRFRDDKFSGLIGGAERLDTMLMQTADRPQTNFESRGRRRVAVCGFAGRKKCPKGLVIALKVEDGDDTRAASGRGR